MGTSVSEFLDELGPPDDITGGLSTHDGLAGCGGTEPDCRFVLWYDATWWVTCWRFGFDERGRLVSVYKFSSP